LSLAVSYLGPSPQTRKPPGANRRVFTYRLEKSQDSCCLSSESGFSRQPLAACRLVGFFLVSTNTLPLTNPLDALLLPRVLRWVAVVFRQKSRCGHLDADGRPWTRRPAKDLVAQLEREEGLGVTVRRVQRSLERLAEAGYLARTQRTKWWGQRDWWYSWEEGEWELQRCRPTALARSASSVSSQGVRNRRPEASQATVQVLPSPLNNQTSLEEGPVEPGPAALDGAGACRRPQAASKGQQPQTPVNRLAGTLQGLQRTVQRATARGFGQQQPVAEAAGEPETWTQGEFRFTRLASGLVVKDALATAPLR
jgi:hypothetical protein